MLYGPGEAPGLRGARPGSRRPRARQPLRRRHELLVSRRNAGRRRPRDRQRRAPRLGDARAAAAPQIDAEVTVLTRHPAPAVLPGNVRWQPADWHRRLLSDAEVREAFRSAAVVVVPVKDVPQPSGQSVTLQASACGRPVVLTRTRGLWDPEALRDGENVLLVPPADPDALAQAVNRVLADPSTAESLGGRRGRRSRRPPPSRATRRGCSRSARRRAPVPDGTRSTVRGRWHCERSRAPRSSTPARRSATSPRACGRSAISAPPAPGAPTSRSSTPTRHRRRAAATSSSARSRASSGAGVSRSRRTGSRVGPTRASSTRSTSTWRGCGASSATTCASSTGWTGRSAPTADTTTARTPGSPR